METDGTMAGDVLRRIPALIALGPSLGGSGPRIWILLNDYSKTAIQFRDARGRRGNNLCGIWHNTLEKVYEEP